MFASVTHYSRPTSSQNKPRKSTTKLHLCLLNAAPLDNTFLVGQRGNIQTGSPQFTFQHVCHSMIPIRIQGVQNLNFKKKKKEKSAACFVKNSSEGLYLMRMIDSSLKLCQAI